MSVLEDQPQNSNPAVLNEKAVGENQADAASNSSNTGVVKVEDVAKIIKLLNKGTAAKNVSKGKKRKARG